MRYYTKLGNSFAINLSDNDFFSSCCGMPIEEDRYLDIWCDEELESNVKYGLLKKTITNGISYTNEVGRRKRKTSTNETAFYNEYYSETVDQFDYIINERTFSDTYINEPDIKTGPEPFTYSNYFTRYYPLHTIHCSKCKKKLVDVFTNNIVGRLITHKTHKPFCSGNKVREVTPTTQYNVYHKKDYFIKRQVFKKFITYNYESGYLYRNEQKYNDKGVYTIRNITYNPNSEKLHSEFINMCIDKRMSYLRLNIPKESFGDNIEFGGLFGWLKYPNAIPIKLIISSNIALRYRKKLELGVKPFMKSIFGNSGQSILKRCEGKYINKYLDACKFLSELIGYDGIIQNFESIEKYFIVSLSAYTNKYDYPLSWTSKKSENVYFTRQKYMFDRYIGSVDRFFNMLNKCQPRDISLSYIVDILHMIFVNIGYTTNNYIGPNTKGLSLVEFHDLVSKDNRILSDNDKREFIIDKKILDKFTYEDTDNNVRYEVAKNVPTLVEYGSNLHNCVSSYKEYVMNKQQLIVGIYNGDGTIKACMNLLIPKSGKWGVGQIKLKNNICIKDNKELADNIRKYLTDRNIVTDGCWDLNDLIIDKRPIQVNDPIQIDF